MAETNKASVIDEKVSIGRVTVSTHDFGLADLELFVTGVIEAFSKNAPTKLTPTVLRNEPDEYNGESMTITFHY